MKLLEYQQAFGAWDRTSDCMRKSIDTWFRLYYHSGADAQCDPCQRVAYSVVSKLCKAIFSEYNALCDDPFYQKILRALSGCHRQAMELTLVGGESYLKPYIGTNGIGLTAIPRDRVLVFGRDPEGELTDVGTVEKSVRGKYYYTLLERRTLDDAGRLTIQNSLYRSLNAHTLGTRVPLTALPCYSALAEVYTYPKSLGGIGFVRLRTPMLNCVDGSAEGVSVYAPAVDLIRNIDRNEAQLCGEFDRGESRIITSRDLLDENQRLTDHLFIGLDEDPQQVGFHIFSPQLREQSYLERKQEYLRNVESLIGLKRGMLADVNTNLRTATEISASEGEFNLTVLDFQRMWESAVQALLGLCRQLAEVYGLGRFPEPKLQMDWGNGVLFDEDKLWQEYRQMALDGMIAPEVALGWRFNMPAVTEKERAAIRSRYMPKISPGQA